MRYGTGHKGICELFNSLGKDNLTVVEIGVKSGDGTESILSTGKVKKIYCVDPYIQGYDSNDPDSDSPLQKCEQLFINKFKNDARVEKVKGTIETFIVKYFDVLSTIDVVYIDGNHTYESCKNDIVNTMKFIKPNVAISGHDYATYPPHIAGVIQAVNEIFTKPDTVFCDTSWLKKL